MLTSNLIIVEESQQLGSSNIQNDYCHNLSNKMLDKYTRTFAQKQASNTQILTKVTLGWPCVIHTHTLVYNIHYKQNEPTQ